MENNFIEMLQNTNFVSGREVNISSIDHANISDIIEFIYQSKEITSVNKLKLDNSIFSQIASISLSGGRYPCASIECRLSKAHQLAQYAALYSDRIYIHNFLSNIVAHTDKENFINEDVIKKRFADDLKILVYLIPLIAEGIIVPITPPNYCPHCIAEKAFGKGEKNRLENAFRQLANDYYDGCTVSVQKKGGCYGVETKADKSLLEHGFCGQFVTKLPKAISNSPRIVSRINAGEKVELSKTMLRHLKHGHALAYYVYRNILFHLSTSQVLKTNFLTNSDQDIKFLKNLSKERELDARNQVIEQYLTCLVPFVESVDLCDILAIRKNEEESFTLFRNVLGAAISEAISAGNSFSVRDAKILYHDVIEPKLTRLDIKVNAAKRKLIKDTRREFLGLTGAITLGIYTGFLPEGLLAAAAALGLGKFVADLTTNIMKRSDAEETVRNEDMYFLWKIKHKQKH